MREPGGAGATNQAYQPQAADGNSRTVGHGHGHVYGETSNLRDTPQAPAFLACTWRLVSG
jgi:hypothetical protein